MAIPFLNNITLNNNEIQNVRLQNGGSPPLNFGPGQIYFDSTVGDETAKYYSNVTDTWVSLKEYSFPTVAKADGYITSIVTGTTAKPIVKFNLNATGTADSTTYLRGDNQWEPISAIPGTYTWSIQGDTGGPTAVASGDAIDFAGGTNVTTDFSGTTLTINATNYDLSGVGSTNGTAGVRLAGSDGTNDDVLIIGAGTTEVTRNGDTLTVTSNDEFDGTVESITAGVGLNGGTITTSGTIALDYNGPDNYILANPNGGDIADAFSKINFHNDDDEDVYYTELGEIPVGALVEVKTYIDNAVAGGLIYQGGFDGSTGFVTGTSDYLDNRGTQIAVNKGWTYTVTTAGTFYGEVVEVGDVLIAEDDLASGTGALTDWTTVQNNIDLATDLQVGIGNVNIDGAGNKDGLALAYASGTATVGLDITNLPNLSVAITAADLAGLEIPLYNGDTSDSNEKIEVATLLSAASKTISYAITITDTDTNIQHGLNTSDVMVQLYDITTGETVYADVDRTSASVISVTFAATPTNSVRVLVQKIG
jgi:hypothetical protein